MAAEHRDFLACVKYVKNLDCYGTVLLTCSCALGVGCVVTVPRACGGEGGPCSGGWAVH